MFALVAAAVCGCGNQKAGKTGKTAKTAAREPDSVRSPLDTINSNGNVVRVRVSEDGKLKYYCWNTGEGGTMPIYGQICQYVGSGGKTITINMDDEDLYKPWIHSVHSVRRDDGTTFYMVVAEHHISTAEGYMWMNAYEIKGDSLVGIIALDPDDGSADSVLCLEYCWAEYSMQEQGEPFEYDTATRNLYVPTTVEDKDCREPLMADRYLVYHFNGKRFVPLGEQPHKGLHKSVGKYKRLLRVFNTKSFTIRIDLLGNGDIRYASWKKPKTISDEPDIIIKGGRFNDSDYSYTFVNDGVRYDVGRLETVAAADGSERDEAFLIVSKGGKVLLKQERFREDE